MFDVVLEIVDRLVDMILIDSADVVSMWHQFQPCVVIIRAFAGPLVGVDIMGSDVAWCCCNSQ